MAVLVTVSEARTRLADLIADADGEEVVLLKHGHPVGVLLAHDRYERLLDHVEDLEDELSVIKADPDDSVPLKEVIADLGL